STNATCGGPSTSSKRRTAFTSIHPGILNLREERDIRGEVIPDVHPDPMAARALIGRNITIEVRVVPDLVPDPRLPSDGQIVHVHFRERGVRGAHRPPGRATNGRGQRPWNPSVHVHSHPPHRCALCDGV